MNGRAGVVQAFPLNRGILSLPCSCLRPLTCDPCPGEEEGTASTLPDTEASLTADGTFRAWQLPQHVETWPGFMSTWSLHGIPQSRAPGINECHRGYYTYTSVPFSTVSKELSTGPWDQPSPPGSSFRDQEKTGCVPIDQHF